LHCWGNLAVYFIAFMTLDFAGYWVHRISHEVNFSGTSYHSPRSEEFNLARRFVRVCQWFLKYLRILNTCCRFGVPESVICHRCSRYTCLHNSGITPSTSTDGFLEKIIVRHRTIAYTMRSTPCISKNYSQIFIFWDKMFWHISGGDASISRIWCDKTCRNVKPNQGSIFYTRVGLIKRIVAYE